MRLYEILSLKKINIHSRKKYIKVVDTKTGKNRTVPMNKSVVRVARQTIGALHNNNQEGRQI